MKRFVLLIAVFLTAFSIASAKAPKYVFYFIGDGMSINAIYGAELLTAARNGQEFPQPSVISSLPYRTFVTAYSANNLTTDSAAAGTALASGVKTNNSVIGRDPEGNDVKNLVEYARESGYGTAIVTTAGISHATPASFFGHANDRDDYEELNQQLIDGGADFFAGAGFNVKTRSKVPVTSAPEWVVKAREAGWNVLVGKDAFKDAAKSPKTICLAYEDKWDLPYAIQNPEVRLEDLYKAGVDNMVKYHRKGFFMMVESSNIDHGGHENDVYAMLEEVNDFSNVIALAVDFYKAHPDETLIVVTADHETSGLALGNNSGRVKAKVLLNQKMAQADLSAALVKLSKTEKPTWDAAKTIISDALGLWEDVKVDYKEEYELRDIFEMTVARGVSSTERTLYAANDRLAGAAIKLLAKKAGMQQVKYGHTGGQVPLFAIGVGAEKIAACRDNTDIPKTIRKVARY